ncbi:MAG TPA: Yip1 family protein [Polyangia bacterium]|jgi:hypothetical protein
MAIVDQATVDRIKRICLKPKDEWQVIASETTSAADLLKNYALPLSAIGALAGFIGMSIVGVGLFRIPLATGLLTAVIDLALMLVLVYGLGLIIDALAPQFGAEKNKSHALKVAVYSFTPGWVAATLQIIPVLSVFWLIGLGYGIYLMHLGLAQLMKPAKDKAVIYTVVVAVCAFVLVFVLN